MTTIKRRHLSDHPQDAVVITEGVATIDLGATFVAKKRIFLITADDDFTLVFSNADVLESGQSAFFQVLILQDETGGHDITWPGTILWSLGLAPELSGTAETYDRFEFQILADGTILGSQSGTGMEAAP